MTAFLIDVAVVGIVAFCAWRGYKSGLIRGVFGVVSLIVALMVANIAAHAYAKEARTMLIPFASGMVESTLTDMRENNIEYQSIAHDHDIEDPDFGVAYTVLREIGLPESAAVALATQLAEDPEADRLQPSFIEMIAEKLTDSLSYIAVFGVAFLILAIIFAVAGNLLGLVFSLPGLKLVDIISGAAFGLFKGIILVFTLAFIVRYFGVLAPPLLEKTSLLNYLVNNNPIANIFGL